MAERKICVVTGSRADYGLLYWPMRGIQAEHPALRLQIVATGSHFSPEHGMTWKAIEADGFNIDCRIDAVPANDDGVAIAAAMGEGVKSIASAVERLQPDVALLLGDRYEILAAAAAALVMRIPVAHIAGGDVTSGAYDDAIRHAISKMAQIHFVTNDGAARRLRQLGEDPAAIHVTGSPGIDAIQRTRLMAAAELEQSLGAKLRQRNALVTFHPVTWGAQPSDVQLSELLKALDRLGSVEPGWGLFFTGVNADNEYRALNRMIEEFILVHPNAAKFDSLGTQRYLSLMALSNFVIGNSSSGLYEAPSMGVPSINIGDRQHGRLRASSVIDCKADADLIGAAIERALKQLRQPVESPYGDGHATDKIIAVLKNIPAGAAMPGKRFHDLDA